MSNTIKLTEAQKKVVKKMREGIGLKRGAYTGNWYLGNETVNYITCYRLEDAGIIVNGGLNTNHYLTDLGKTIELD